MRDVVVVGAGKIGATIADMLAASGTIASRSSTARRRRWLRWWPPA